MFSRFKKLLLLIFIVAMIGFAGYQYFKMSGSNIKALVPLESTKIESVKEEAISPVCSRTDRYDNKPQYERVLSLINQRIVESFDEEKKNGPNTLLPAFRYFPPELTNCIMIEEKNMSEAEGYFISNNKDIKSNYFPIYVSSNYSQTDDLTTAVLLVHEMTHVQQYLNKLNNKEVYKQKDLDCIYEEVDAFISQWDFYNHMNIDEVESIGDRAFVGSQNRQVKMIEFMNNKTRMLSNTCGLSMNCEREVLRIAMFDHLWDDPFYKKQCDI